VLVVTSYVINDGKTPLYHKYFSPLLAFSLFCRYMMQQMALESDVSGWLTSCLNKMDLRSCLLNLCAPMQTLSMATSGFVSFKSGLFLTTCNTNYPHMPNILLYDISSSSFYLPNNTIVCTFVQIRF